MTELAAASNAEFPNIQPPPPVQPRDPAVQTSACKQSSVENDHSQPQQQAHLQQQHSESSGGSEGEDSEHMSAAIKRALSCDSVCSDTSVALGDLEEINVTGYLCIGFEYER
ncbi:hypothetical protein QE152_g27291 [Popillia japonica]|uniref:Uncharacterized protein n=1 Tax=Popillia japonica TaxID=7064 RepID=A0AAW1JVJ1_POPJA